MIAFCQLLIYKNYNDAIPSIFLWESLRPHIKHDAIYPLMMNLIAKMQTRQFKATVAVVILATIMSMPILLPASFAHPPATNPSINLVNKPGCTWNGANMWGDVFIMNTGSDGDVTVEWAKITLFWQVGGGDWHLADPQSVETNLQPGIVITPDNREHLTYFATFTSPPDTREYRSIVEVKLVNRADVFTDTRHFLNCESFERSESASSTSETIFSTSSSTATLTIRSTDKSGNELSGIWAEIWDGTTLVADGFTPLSHSIQTGKQFSVSVSDWQETTFDHWEDASTERLRQITISQDTAVMAFFNTGSESTQSTSPTTQTTATLTVKTSDMQGAPIEGLWVELWQNGVIIQEGFSPFSASVQTGTQYEVFVYNWENNVFDHWEDGSTNQLRTITPDEDATLTAFYNT